jgi:hypothetical protein
MIAPFPYRKLLKSIYIYIYCDYILAEAAVLLMRPCSTRRGRPATNSAEMRTVNIHPFHDYICTKCKHVCIYIYIYIYP